MLALVLYIGCLQQYEKLDWWLLLSMSDCLWSHAGGVSNKFWQTCRICAW